MFFGVTTTYVDFELRGFRKETQKPGQIPSLIMQVKHGEPFTVYVCLQPISQNEITLILSEEDSAATLRASSLEQVASLPALSEVIRVLESSTLRFGENPRTALERAFHAPPGSDEVDSQLLKAAWWLKFGLAGEGYTQYRAFYHRLRVLLRYVRGVRVPRLRDVRYEMGNPEGNFGVKLISLLEVALPQITRDLQSTLKNESLTANVRALRVCEFMHPETITAIAQWSHLFGPEFRDGS